MLQQCLQFVFAMTFCFQMNAQISHVDNRPFYVEDFDATVTEDTRATYLDLLRKVFLNAEIEDEKESADRAIKLRNLQHPKEIKTRGNPVEISSVQGLWIADEGEERLALLINAQEQAEDGMEEFDVLAIFKIQPKLQLIDAAEVDFDRFIGFWEESPLLPVRQGETAFWIRATHHNSSEGFHSYILTELRDNRLRIIFDNPLSLMNTRLCNSEEIQKLNILAGRGLFAQHIVYDLRVSTEINPTEGCEEEKPVKESVVNKFYRLRWNTRQKRYRAALLKSAPGRLNRK